MARRRPQLPLPGIEPGNEPIEITIPTMDWEQIGGDVDPGAHGGVLASADGRAIELIEIQPVRDYVGDKEAADVGFPFWTKRAYFDAADLNLDNDDVQSAMQSVGLNVEALEDMKPEQRAIALAEALLQWGRGDEGPAGWSADIEIPSKVKWWGGKVEGAEYLADEDDAFRNEVLGYDDIRSAVEETVQRFADQRNAEGWSTVGDQTLLDLEKDGYDPSDVVGVTDFGGEVAVNGDYTEESLHAVEAKLEKEGYELTDYGGRIPTSETEVSAEHVVTTVAEEMDRTAEDVEKAAESLDWWQENIPWSSSGDGSVWAKKLEGGVTEKRAPRRGRQRQKAEAGFSISVYDQRMIEDNANSRFSQRWGDPADREHAMKDGMVDAEGEITQAGWDQLADDITRIERNSMAWMRKKFINARDDGHDKHDDLIGSFWFDPTDYEQSRIVELASDTGRQERIDMVDVSYGDLGDSAFDGISDFGASVLGGAIYFFDVKPEDMEALVATLDRGEREVRRK